MLSWPHVGSNWPHVGFNWPQVGSGGPMRVPIWPHVGFNWPQVGSGGPMWVPIWPQVVPNGQLTIAECQTREKALEICIFVSSTARDPESPQN